MSFSYGSVFGGAESKYYKAGTKKKIILSTSNGWFLGSKN